MSDFDMNALLRSRVREDQPAGEERTPEPESIGGKADGGAGEERSETGATDMNSFLRDAVFEPRGRSS